MLKKCFPAELPRALQHILERDQVDGPADLPRRTFLKVLGAGGLALGAFPYLAQAQFGVGAGLMSLIAKWRNHTELTDCP